MLQTEKINTRILCPNTLPESRTVNEIMWKNIVEPERRQITVYV